MIGGSATAKPPIVMQEVVSLRVEPYGPGCVSLPSVSFQWEDPVIPEVWDSDPELPEMDYCGYTVNGLRICCPK